MIYICNEFVSNVQRYVQCVRNQCAKICTMHVISQALVYIYYILPQFIFAYFEDINSILCSEGKLLRAYCDISS